MGLAPRRDCAYIAHISGAVWLRSESTTGKEQRAARPFFCVRNLTRDGMTDLIAKTAIDRRMAESSRP
ncbi:hypothetical protein roselon_01123 [Roseibacterium elongatum DSM 19469]|uniref:Uncharacterized protein n=1 Tax=Roseicyclus elongatus DSM 19469 TaxID=1294273 RepID=W8SLW3_9RHOB|nr:hypothetical protein roselon_01123 [Roseibacterium elongatum DSM 19469]